MLIIYTKVTNLGLKNKLIDIRAISKQIPNYTNL